MSKLHDSSTWKSVKHISMPVLVSVVAIFVILATETIIYNYLPSYLSPIFLYLSLTGFILYNLYATPLLVFNGI